MPALRSRGNLTIERVGVNFVRGVVEEAGSLFKEVNLQHDFGHDASILLVVDGEVQPREIALQIKSGKTYNRSGHCRIPVTAAHLSFWAQHDLQTLGVVYDPSERRAYWMDLKAYAKALRQSRSTPKSITFRKSLWKRFDSWTFSAVLVPVLMHRAPHLDLQTALQWAQDDDFDTHAVGVRVLLARHYVEKATSEVLIGLFRDRPSDELTHLVPAAFSKMLGTWELSYSFTTAQLPPDVKELAHDAVSNFGVDGVSKLLEFLDHDEGFDFSRGTLGQAFTHIFEVQPNMLDLFRTIATSEQYPDTIREMALKLGSAYSNDPRWYW
jgi:hypothetical protein